MLESLGNCISKYPYNIVRRRCSSLESESFWEISLERYYNITAQEVTASRARFPKPFEEYLALSFFGHNIVVSEGEEWKKYRKISAPAFSDVSLPCWSRSWYHGWHDVRLQHNNKLVWDETVKIMQDLSNNVWANQDVISVDHFVDITYSVCYLIDHLIVAY